MVDDVTRELVAARVADLIHVLEAEKPKLVAAADLDGARKHAAAAMLMRAVELLSAAVAADGVAGSRAVVELATRSIFELTSRGRYLLIGANAANEFSRMCRDAERRESQLAEKTGNRSPGLPTWLSELLPSEADRPRDLWSICVGLDQAEGRAAADSHSGQASYQLLYAWLSNSAAHAGMSALKRFTTEVSGVLRLVATPEDLTTHWPLPIVAAHVGELAVAVFHALGVDDAALVETGVRLPS